LIAILKQMRTMQSLSDAAVRSLADVSTLQPLRPGQPLWRMGDLGEYIGVVLSGCLEVNRLSPEGKEFGMGFFGPCDVVGITAVLKKIPYPCTARAFARDTKVVKIYLRSVIQRADPPLALEISEWLKELILSHQQILLDKVDITSAGKTETRVFELLLQLNRRFGVKTSRTGSVIPLSISRTQVSRLVDVRPETAIRLFALLKKANLLYFEQDGIRIPDWNDLKTWIDREKPESVQALKLRNKLGVPERRRDLSQFGP
jgi:CRP-like cAMP-binding protein